MGRLSKVKVDEIKKLRREGYTQEETAIKVGVHVRTVMKHDLLKEQKATKPLTKEDIQLEEALTDLVAKDLVYKNSNGEVRISFLGRKIYERYNELVTKAILEFMSEKNRPVHEDEIDGYLNGINAELFDQAFYEVKSRYH